MWQLCGAMLKNRNRVRVLSVRANLALKCSPAQWFRVVAKRKPSSVSHGACLSHATTNENLSAMTSDMGKVLKPDAGRTFVAFAQAYVQPPVMWRSPQGDFGVAGCPDVRMWEGRLMAPRA